MTRWSGIWGMMIVATAGLAAAPVWAGTSTVGSQDAQIETVSGSIAELDLDATPRQVHVSTGGRKVALAIPSTGTYVTKDGEVLSLQQLKVGQKVQVRHRQRDGEDVATTIEVVSKGKPAPLKSTAKKQPEVKKEPEPKVSAAKKESEQKVSAVKKDSEREQSVAKTEPAPEASVAKEASARENAMKQALDAGNATVLSAPLAAKPADSAAAQACVGSLVRFDSSVVPAGLLPNATGRPGASVTGPLVLDGTAISASQLPSAVQAWSGYLAPQKNREPMRATAPAPAQVSTWPSERTVEQSSEQSVAPDASLNVTRKEETSTTHTEAAAPTSDAPVSNDAWAASRQNETSATAPAKTEASVSPSESSVNANSSSDKPVSTDASLTATHQDEAGATQQEATVRFNDHPSDRPSDPAVSTDASPTAARQDTAATTEPVQADANASFERSGEWSSEWSDERPSDKPISSDDSLATHQDAAAATDATQPEASASPSERSGERSSDTSFSGDPSLTVTREEPMGATDQAQTEAAASSHDRAGDGYGDSSSSSDRSLNVTRWDAR